MHNQITFSHWVDAYLSQPLTVDKLPYTSELKAIRDAVSAAEARDYTDEETFHCLLGMRKRGELPRRQRRIAC